MRTKQASTALSNRRKNSKIDFNDADADCPFDEIKINTRFPRIAEQETVVSTSESRDDDVAQPNIKRSDPFDEQVALWLRSGGYVNSDSNSKKILQKRTKESTLEKDEDDVNVSSGLLDRDSRDVGNEQMTPWPTEIRNDENAWSDMMRSDPLNHNPIPIAGDLRIREHAVLDSSSNNDEEDVISTVSSDSKSNFNDSSAEESSLEDLVGIFLAEKSRSETAKVNPSENPKIKRQEEKTEIGGLVCSSKDKENMSTKDKASLLEFACGLVLEEMQEERKARSSRNDDNCSSSTESAGDLDSSSSERASSDDCDSYSSQSASEVSSEDTVVDSLSGQEVSRGRGQSTQENESDIVPFKAMIPQMTCKENDEGEIISDEDREESDEKRKNENNERLENLEEFMIDYSQQQEQELNKNIDDDVLPSRSFEIAEESNEEENDSSSVVSEQQIEDAIIADRSVGAASESVEEEKRDTDHDDKQQTDDSDNFDHLKAAGSADELIWLIASDGMMAIEVAPEQQRTEDFHHFDHLKAASSTDELIRLIASNGTMTSDVTPDHHQADDMIMASRSFGTVNSMESHKDYCQVDDMIMENRSFGTAVSMESHNKEIEDTNIDLSYEQSIVSSDDRVTLSARSEEEENILTDNAVLSKDIEGEDMILAARSIGGQSVEEGQQNNNDESEAFNMDFFVSLSFEEKIHNIVRKPPKRELTAPNFATINSTENSIAVLDEESNESKNNAEKRENHYHGRHDEVLPVFDNDSVVEEKKLLVSNAIEVVLVTDSNDDNKQRMSEEIIMMDNLKCSSSDMEKENNFNRVYDDGVFSTLMNNNSIVLVSDDGENLRKTNASSEQMSHIGIADDLILQQRRKEEPILEQEYAELIMNNDLIHETSDGAGNNSNKKQDNDYEYDDNRKNGEEERILSNLTGRSISSNKKKENDHDDKNDDFLSENDAAVNYDEQKLARDVISEMEHGNVDTTYYNEQRCDELTIIVEGNETSTTGDNGSSRRSKNDESDNSSSTNNEMVSMQSLTGKDDDDDDIVEDDDEKARTMMLANSKSFEVNHFVVVNTNKRESSTSLFDKIFPW